jgi:signal transduction histidine kinase/FixJ family two-component response regulator
MKSGAGAQSSSGRKGKGTATTEGTPSNPNLLRVLEQEKPAQQAVSEVGRQPGLAGTLESLSSVLLAEDDLDLVLKKLLDVFVDTARSDAAVILLRDGERLWSRAARGVKDEVAAGFSIPLAEAIALGATVIGPRLISGTGAAGAFASEFMRTQGVRSLYCINLLHADTLVGVVLLGHRAHRELSDEEKHVLSVAAAHAAAAVVRNGKYESLRTAIRSRDEVLAVVAHDLKNPLNVIGVTAGSLLRRLPESSVRRPIQRIIRAAERAERLVRDLAEITAIETGRFSIERRGVEPADVILAALELQQGLAADASVIIAADLSPDVPAIEADEERLLEVLENLIGNSVKFTASGGSITVGAARRDGRVVFWVKDNGSGIAAAELPHIFDRFWHAKKTKRRGTGLGLSICKGIVEAHGGRIWAESVANRGTTVFFTVPITAAPKEKAKHLHVANILLVDDRPENLLSLKAILESPEYRLVTAASGEEALALALREPFSLALIDVAMPGMNGLEVATHLKELERSRDIPIIFITAFGDDPEEVHRAYSAGGADYLVKPLDPEIVRKKVAVFVELSRRRNESESRLKRTRLEFEEPSNGDRTDR